MFSITEHQLVKLLVSLELILYHYLKAETAELWLAALYHLENPKFHSATQ